MLSLGNKESIYVKEPCIDIAYTKTYDFVSNLAYEHK